MKPLSCSFWMGIESACYVHEHCNDANALWRDLVVAKAEKPPTLHYA
jgi:hypothetical protein